MPPDKKRFICGTCNQPMKALSGLTAIDGTCGGTKCANKMELIKSDPAVVKALEGVKKLWALPPAQRDTETNGALIETWVGALKKATGAALAANAAEIQNMFHGDLVEVTQLTLESAKRTAQSIKSDDNVEKQMEELEQLQATTNEALGIKVRADRVFSARV